MLSFIVGNPDGDWETKSLPNFGNGQNKTLYVHLSTIVLSSTLSISLFEAELFLTSL